MKRLFVIERRIEGAWKPMSVYKFDNFHRLLGNMPALASHSEYRIKRVRSADEAKHLLTKTLSTSWALRVQADTEPIEWVT